MHFAFPPRKTSHPPPYAIRTSPSRNLTSLIRRHGRLRTAGVSIAAALTFLWLLRFLFGSGLSVVHIPANTPKVVVVTVFDLEGPGAGTAEWRKGIMDNRKDYASRHGYTTFFPNTSAYPLPPSTPKSWTLLPAIRHAMTLHPHSQYIFHLAPTALIMAPTLDLDTHILDSTRLESLMEVDKPVVPPDSVIRTFTHLRASNIDFVISQDSKGLSSTSMIIRSGDWARYFLDAWFDPLYRTYNFQKAERHALEHIVQWHGTILSHLAMVPQNILNSYVSTPATLEKNKAKELKDTQYKEGDFIANFADCDKRIVPYEKGKKKVGVKTRNECESEQGPLMIRWREVVDAKGRGT